MCGGAVSPIIENSCEALTPTLTLSAQNLYYLLYEERLSASHLRTPSCHALSLGREGHRRCSASCWQTQADGRRGALAFDGPLYKGSGGHSGPGLCLSTITSFK